VTESSIQTYAQWWMETCWRSQTWHVIVCSEGVPRLIVQDIRDYMRPQYGTWPYDNSSSSCPVNLKYISTRKHEFSRPAWCIKMCVVWYNSFRHLNGSSSQLLNLMIHIQRYYSTGTLTWQYLLYMYILWTV